MPTITVPFNFKPRPYQLPLLRAMDSGQKRAVVVWHRRCGKDKTSIQIVVKKMLERVGSYYYFFPTYNQGRKILWDGMDKDGFKFMSHFPKELLDGKPNDTEMNLKFKNGSQFQIIGTDKINNIVGTNPVGCVFSEYSLQNPQAWDFMRPILKENGGWALFDYTPRGKNHGWKLYEMARNNPEWFCQKLSVTDTGIVSEEDIEKERREGMDEDLIQQEYYCSFEGSVQGSYYSKQLRQAEKENRITNVPYEVGLPVDTWWDLGVGDATSIWFSQTVGKEIRFIDYLEAQGEGLEYYAKELQLKPYIYGQHHAPFDISVKELGTGKTRKEMAQSFGINFDIVPQLSLEDGINAVRAILNQCWFDKTNCELGINCLSNYHKQYDEDRKLFKNHPEHDWSSHGADAFRYFAVGYRRIIKAISQSQQPSDPFNPFFSI